MRPVWAALLHGKHVHRNRHGLFEWHLHRVRWGESALLHHWRRLRGARHFLLGHDLHNHWHSLLAHLRYHGRRLCFGNRPRLLHLLRPGQDRQQDLHLHLERVEMSSLLLPGRSRLCLLQAVGSSSGLRSRDVADCGGQLHGDCLLDVRRLPWQRVHRHHRRRAGWLLRLHQQPLELRAHQGMALPWQPRLLAYAGAEKAKRSDGTVAGWRAAKKDLVPCKNSVEQFKPLLGSRS
jgi:hypothetical protein